MHAAASPSRLWHLLPRTLLSQTTCTTLWSICLAICVAAPVSALSPQAAKSETASQDSAAQETPSGTIEGPFEWKSTIFPGTVRRYWIYIPAQYDPDQPACLMVVQDGLGLAKNWKLIEAWDSLIASGEIPVQIGLMIEPGVVPAPHENAQPRFNRSFEYDSLGDRYARFLIEEMIPEVKKRVNISDDPNDRAIGGASSGAICAFTVAWERPDQFRRVLSTIGTYVSLRGGNEYPALVRKSEPKPLRVFLEDGTSDLDLYGGSWWLANQEMLSALEFSGYEVKAIWGDGGHNSKHASEIMPEAMRWLWQGWPEPIQSGVGKGNQRRTDVLIPGSDWELVSEGHRFTEGPAVNDAGEVFFTDIPANTIYKVDLDGKATEWNTDSQGAVSLMFGPDGLLYANESATKRIVRYTAEGEKQTVVEDAPANDFVLLPTGGYYTAPNQHELWHFTYDGKTTRVDEGLKYPNGIIVSPDQTRLIVADTQDRFTYVYQIQPDGSLLYKQPYGHLHRLDDQADTGADGMTVDVEGRVYVASRSGVQILDQLGRVHLILSRPGTGWLSNVVFGGPDLDILYATCGDKVFRRPLKTQGVRSTGDPVAPPRPSL